MFFNLVLRDYKRFSDWLVGSVVGPGVGPVAFATPVLEGSGDGPVAFADPVLVALSLLPFILLLCPLRDATASVLFGAWVCRLA